jgi:hypothetical protein
MNQGHASSGVLYQRLTAHRILHAVMMASFWDWRSPVAVALQRHGLGACWRD